MKMDTRSGGFLSMLLVIIVLFGIAAIVALAFGG